MPCFRPIPAWRSKTVNPDTGKRSMVFTAREAYTDLQITLPCGQCIGCRLERSRQWAMRCVHEASLYERNCFLTLTYSDENIPKGNTLVKKDFQDFMKRLRKAVGTGVRYFHCGEYGEKLGRPHYHACLFNYDFPDKKLWKKSEGGDLYVSEKLNELWGRGYCILGAVTFDSAAYVARYITKKITGPNAETHYNGRTPEYTTMSRRPGIGLEWFKKFRTDCYPSDSVIMRGKEMRPPKFYDNKFELDFPKEFFKVKANRKSKVREAWDPENSPARQMVKEEVQLRNLNHLKRSYEKC